MSVLSIPTARLADGSELPLIGLGTYPLLGQAAAQAVTSAINLGYRLIDTAQQYNNEAAVGEGIRRSGIDPDELVVTTKVAGGSQGRGLTRASVEMSLKRLGLARLGLVLIHWPNPSRELAAHTWEDLIALREEGLVAHIGTSNFRPEQLAALERQTGVRSEVNQIQLSPAAHRTEAVRYHDEQGIITQAWGPLGHRDGLADQWILQQIALRRGATPAQVSLRWAIDRGIVVIPKSADPQRQRTNADIAGIRLSDEDRAQLALLDRGEEFVKDSRDHEEW